MLLLARLDRISCSPQAGAEPRVAVEEVEASWAPIVPKVNEFHYKGQYWCIPEYFELRKDAKQLNGWRMWLCGQVVVSKNVSYKLKPFRLLTDRDFHRKSI